MGAWRIHFNECDGALDFLGDLGDSQDWSAVERQIEIISSDEAYEQGEEILAAAEIVAAAVGKPSARLDEAHQHWAVTYSVQGNALRTRAIEAAQFVKTESELAELWTEADQGTEWQATVDELISRLQDQ
jgi:hypothetical protein